MSKEAEVLQPKAKTVYYKLGEGEDEITLSQKPLTFFGKMEFFSVLGGAMEKVLNEGVSFSEIFEGAEDTPNLLNNKQSLKEADVFVKALASLIQHVPETLLDLYCVILNVPRDQRYYVAGRLERDLNDEQGVQILDTFIDQNAEVLVNFFSERMIPLFKKVNSRFLSSEPSKP